ncbi:SDR family NAD(P)-dependent oxidoreductase [Novosphingobium bradum]|uniref:SDR family NAD(P)-dependent oxidoreductase n=1 Tax=Novosphingobium bradum TaxID=1737444 RepID=A0ABV7IKJ0_9SPHN
MPLDPPVNFSIDLAGRTALVTGAGSGIGLRFARVLAACGARVALAGRRADRLEALAAEIRADGGTALAVALDVSRSEAIAPAIDRIEAELGLVDILVNNAGLPDAHYATKLSPEKVDAVIDTNLRGPWVLSCEVARRLMAAGAPGKIVNVSSMAAFTYSAARGAALYATTKGGLVRMTEVLAREWAGFGINVNALAPGAIASEMMDAMVAQVGDGFLQSYPRKRLGQPEGLDSSLLFLVSPASDYVTGTCIKADDGQSPA